MASIAERRKKFMDHLCKIMDLLDPTGDNSKLYHQKLDPMSDKEFDRWVQRFLADPKCAEFMGVPLFERVAMPYLTGDPDNVIVTPEPVPVGWIHEKRMPQTLMKKSHGSISIDKRDPRTGQVTGDDKSSRNSDQESVGMVAVGAMYGLRELMGPRADDMVAKNQMYNAIAKNGYVSLEELEDDPYNKVSLNSFNAYFLMQGVCTNLVSELGFIPGPEKPTEK